MTELHLDSAVADILTCADLHAHDRLSGTLAGLCLTIPEPAIVGLLSPQPASLLLLADVLTRARPCRSGEIYLKGLRLHDLQAKDVVGRGLVRTMARATLPPNATVYELLAISLQFGRLREGADSRAIWMAPDRKPAPEIEEAIELAGLAAILDASVVTLPWAERVRVELGRCLVQGPDLIIAEHLCCDLNAADHGDIAGILSRIRDLGVAILVIDHDTTMLSELCERILVINDGQLMAEGPPSTIGANPAVQIAFTGMVID